jgi:hypothetical protein
MLKSEASKSQEKEGKCDSPEKRSIPIAAGRKGLARQEGEKK